MIQSQGFEFLQLLTPGEKKQKKAFLKVDFLRRLINSLSFFSLKHFERELLKRSILKGLLGIFYI
jgi:hypothetical protein